ncbi:MAG: hypothetical protein JXA78_12280 [Anaerolineales bacterium]|nr:hypothetical protein [Anaerolineales bacterium]
MCKRLGLVLLILAVVLACSLAGGTSTPVATESPTAGSTAGAGCSHRVSGENSLELDTSIGALRLEREGDALKADGKIVGS